MSAANWAVLHLGTACGLPTSPAGKLTIRSLVSSVAGLAANDVEIFRSGWPPACVVLGVTLNAVTLTAAEADAGMASRARAHGERQDEVSRPSSVRSLPVAPQGHLT